ncbi:MAG: SoxR reducing system RseC family protein [Clostridia bacterium]|nr:SoxR reducing system RseC family protein [Clostridia bacterium]
MEQIGIVKQIIRTEAVVLVRRASACGENCAHCKGGCQPTNITAKVENKAGAAVGDTVKIETDTKGVILAAVLLYFVPCLVAIMGAVISRVLTPQKWVAALVSIFAFLAAFCVVQKIDKRIAPVSIISKIISANNEKV